MENYRELYVNQKIFDATYHALGEKQGISKDFLYQAYVQIIDALLMMLKERDISTIGRVRPMVILSYLLNEHVYSTMGAKKEEIARFEANENYQKRICSIVLDKYFTLQHLHYQADTEQNQFYPPISSIQLYVTFLLHLLKQFKQKDPEETLLIDILHKGFTMCQCISELLVKNFETEAFSTWRTLHETECNAILLYRYGKPIIQAYLKHITYGLAFRNTFPDKEEQDRIFVKLKEEMKAHDLKSKDMKRFIECGWLYVIPNCEQHPDFRLNFRNGTENLAGLSSYNHLYEMSSEVAHSSPLLIYSNQSFFFYLTVTSLYDSFLRLERIFYEVYISTVEPEKQQQYLIMRKTYLPQLEIIQGIEKQKLAKLQKK